MKQILFILLLATTVAGCATTKGNNCPVAVIEVSQPNAGNVGHK